MSDEGAVGYTNPDRENLGDGLPQPVPLQPSAESGGPGAGALRRTRSVHRLPLLFQRGKTWYVDLRKLGGRRKALHTKNYEVACRRAMVEVAQHELELLSIITYVKRATLASALEDYYPTIMFKDRAFYVESMRTLGSLLRSAPTLKMLRLRTYAKSWVEEQVKSGVGPQEIERKLAVLRAFVQWAEERFKLGDMRKMERLYMKTWAYGFGNHHFMIQTAETLDDLCRRPIYEKLIKVGMATGAKKWELFRLRWEDIRDGEVHFKKRTTKLAPGLLDEYQQESGWVICTSNNTPFSRVEQRRLLLKFYTLVWQRFSLWSFFKHAHLARLGLKPKKAVWRDAGGVGAALRDLIVEAADVPEGHLRARVHPRRHRRPPEAVPPEPPARPLGIPEDAWFEVEMPAQEHIQDALDAALDAEREREWEDARALHDEILGEVGHDPGGDQQP